LEKSDAVKLVKAEAPELPFKRYSDDQLERAQVRLAEAIQLWGWNDRKDAKQLYLARRMIARRLGFLSLHDLFNGSYASTRAQNAYEEGEHFLLKPFVETIVPLATAHRNNNASEMMRILTSNTVAFRPTGPYSNKPIQEVKKIANEATEYLASLLTSEKLGDILRYCLEHGLIVTSDRLSSHLDRPPREEEYDEDKHSEDKADWLADSFFKMDCGEVEKYCHFLDKNTVYSTQHGVKGEQYDDVIVVFDDTEAAWHNYSFAKMLTPQAAGEPKDSQKDRSRKLAYVCFSRAVQNLRILLFTPNPDVSASELIGQRLFQETQICILS
jgi:DNA helicase II / ATP-dependent DNA helicase PcrA